MATFSFTKVNCSCVSVFSNVSSETSLVGAILIFLRLLRELCDPEMRPGNGISYFHKLSWLFEVDGINPEATFHAGSENEAERFLRKRF